MRGRPLALIIILAIVCGGLAFGAIQSGLFSKKPGWRGHHGGGDGPKLQFLELKTTSHPVVIETNGLVIPDVKVVVSALREGTVDKVDFTVGKSVTADNTLVTIDNRLAKIDLAERKAALRRAELEVTQARRDLDRQKKLKDDKIVSEEDVEAAQLKLDTATADRDRAQEAVNRAQRIFDEHELKSPISGVVLKRFVDKGTHVRQGTPVAEVLFLDRMRIEAGLTEAKMLRVRRGKPVVFGKSRALRQDTFHKLAVKDVRVSLEALEGTRTYPVYFIVDNTGPEKVFPGMSLKLRIETGLRREGLHIPASAVVTRSGKTFAWIDKAGEASLVEIDIISRHGDEVRISGMEEGTRVVISGFEELKDGQKLKPKGPPRS